MIWMANDVHYLQLLRKLIIFVAVDVDISHTSYIWWNIA